MGLPQDNPDGYNVSSVVRAAGKLHGKLLILHGAIDDNVSLRNTMRFVDALQDANKDFELMIYPTSRHGICRPHYTGFSSTSSGVRSERPNQRYRPRRRRGRGHQGRRSSPRARAGFPGGREGRCGRIRAR